MMVTLITSSCFPYPGMELASFWLVVWQVHCNVTCTECDEEIQSGGGEGYTEQPQVSYMVSMLCFLTKREGGTCIYSAPKQESKTFDKLHIVKPFYRSICTYNSINRRNLHVKGLRCEFQLLYILAILKKCCCDVTDNI